MKLARIPPRTYRGSTQVVHASGGVITTNVSISDVGDIAHVRERLLGINSSNGGNNTASIQLTSPTNLRIKTAVQSATATTVTVYWEYTIDPAITAQRGYTSLSLAAHGTASTTPAINSLGDTAYAGTDHLGVVPTTAPNATTIGYARSSIGSSTSMDVSSNNTTDAPVTHEVSWVAWKEAA